MFRLIRPGTDVLAAGKYAGKHICSGDIPVSYLAWLHHVLVLDHIFDKLRSDVQEVLKNSLQEKKAEDQRNAMSGIKRFCRSQYLNDIGKPVKIKEAEVIEIHVSQYGNLYLVLVDGKDLVSTRKLGNIAEEDLVPKIGDKVSFEATVYDQKKFQPKNINKCNHMIQEMAGEIPITNVNRIRHIKVNGREATVKKEDRRLKRWRY